MPIDVTQFILPELPVKESAGLVRLNQAAQQNREFNYQKQKEGERDKLYNLNQIKQATDPEKFKDVEQHVDEISNQKLSDIQEKALKEYANLSPEQAQYLLSQDMKEFLSWHNEAKSAVANINKRFTEFKKENPNIPANQAYDYVTNSFLKDFTTVDKNGRITYVNPTMIQPKDYVAELYNPDVIQQFDVDISPNSPFHKAISQIPRTAIGGKEYNSNKGFSHKFNWSGIATPYTEIIEDDKGRPTGMQLKTDRTVGNIKLIPKELKDDLMSDGAIRNTMIAMWGKEKKRLADKGVQIDPKTEPELFDAFLYNKVSEQLPHDIKTETADVVPKPVNITNINMPGYGQTNSQEKNEFDRIELPPPIFNKNIAGTRIIKPDKIPAQMSAVLKAAGMDISSADEFEVEVDGKGVIQSVTPIINEGDKSEIGRKKPIYRQDMVNAQYKYNNEPMKGPQLQFGPDANKPKQTVPKNTKPTKVDLSTLDPNGFKKDGNNWRYKDGRLFDNKGNLINK